MNLFFISIVVIILILFFSCTRLVHIENLPENVKEKIKKKSSNSLNKKQEHFKNNNLDLASLLESKIENRNLGNSQRDVTITYSIPSRYYIQVAKTLIDWNIYFIDIDIPVLYRLDYQYQLFAVIKAKYNDTLFYFSIWLIGTENSSNLSLSTYDIIGEKTYYHMIGI